VLVAVSGGADSVCLLHLLWRLREKFTLSLCVGHVNHLLRGEEAIADARHVQELAQGLGLPVEVVEIDVKALARKKKLSMEDAGRQARYQALEEMAARMGADCIAVGHTTDDQIETILLNFLRGGGPEGLAGMPASRPFLSGPPGRIIRPLLEVRKAETEAYCRKEGLAVRLDATNLEPFALRNRLRHHLLPLLSREQPALEKVLLRQAEIFRAEEEFLRIFTGMLLAEIASPEEGERGIIAFSAERLAELPLALGRRVVREALRRLRENRHSLAMEQIERVLSLAREGSTGKRLSLGGGLRAEKKYGKLLLSRVSDAESQIPIPSEMFLPIPGEIDLPDPALRLCAERIQRGEVADLRADEGGSIAFLDAAKLADTLTVRFPRPGDRFIPLGAKGQMKLHDFFINRKVSRAQRARVLLVCQGEDIVWVVGYRIDDRFKVTERTHEVLRLEIIKKGG